MTAPDRGAHTKSPLLRRGRPHMTFDIPPRLGLESTQMYGSAVRCKRLRAIGRLAVLHQCIRPLVGACCAPGHHGYQRAFELISGQASNGPFGSPVFACAGKTDPPSSSYPLADLGG